MNNIHQKGKNIDFQQFVIKKICLNLNLKKFEDYT